MHRSFTSVALLALLATPALAAGQTLLLSPAQLADRLQDPKLVILHVGDKAGYDAAHIPGARFADRNTLHRRAEDLTLQMLEPEVLRDRLAALGISDDSQIVVYAAGGWFTPATRVMLTLHWAGFDDVSLVDGGLEAWVREKRPVTAETPAVTAGSISPRAVRPVVVDAAFVQANVGKAGFAVVDARTQNFYDGTQTGGSQTAPHKTGHIAGAVSLPFSTLTTDAGEMKAVPELRTLFANAGIKPGDTVVAYCHIGQQATAVIFAARLLGHKVVLYDGSFEDWSRRNLPAEKR